MRTWNPSGNDTVEQKWWIVDATGKNLGRMCTEIASILRGKHKPTFTPNADMGDFVIVINSEKIEMTGNKWDVKQYYRHSGYFGHLRSRSASEMRDFDPTFIIKDAVEGMLPNNKLASRLLTKLKAYKGSEHPHAAQKPETLTLK